MRFFVQPAPGRPRPPVRIFLAFAALALLGFGAHRVLAGGLSPGGIEAFYLGGGAAEALSPAALWEEVHQGAFVYGFILFMLGSLAVVCPVSPRLRGTLLGTAFAATLADLFAPFAIVSLRGAGALRVATFAVASLALGALLVLVAASYSRSGGSGRA